MDSQPRSLRALFTTAENQRHALDNLSSTISSTYQENLASAITSYEESLKIANEVSLFSPNETLEDINSGDLQYLLINFHLAELVQKITAGDRKTILRGARTLYERFLKLLDSYDLLGKSDARLYEVYKDAPDTFSTASTTDATARRETKIARFKEEKELKRKLEVSTTFLPLRRTISNTRNSTSVKTPQPSPTTMPPSATSTSQTSTCTSSKPSPPSNPSLSNFKS